MRSAKDLKPELIIFLRNMASALSQMFKVAIARKPISADHAILATVGPSSKWISTVVFDFHALPLRS
jgi:hypothetical protein